MPDNNNFKIPSNRSFGIVFFFVFILISLWPLLNDENIRLWSFLISLVFLILGLLNSRVLYPLNKLWANFGILLGKFISPIIMFIIFFIVVTPTGLLMRLFKKNLLNLKKKKCETYWIKAVSKSNMKDQF